METNNSGATTSPAPIKPAPQGGHPAVNPLLLILIAIGGLALILGAAFFWMTYNSKAITQNMVNLADSADQAAFEAEISIPSVNPVAAVAPAVNPIEKTNPFASTYANPFE